MIELRIVIQDQEAAHKVIMWADHLEKEPSIFNLENGMVGMDLVFKDNFTSEMFLEFCERIKNLGIKLAAAGGCSKDMQNRMLTLFGLDKKKSE